MIVPRVPALYRVKRFQFNNQSICSESHSRRAPFICVRSFRMHVWIKVNLRPRFDRNRPTKTNDFCHRRMEKEATHAFIPHRL